jgi:hypothetical protein
MGTPYVCRYCSKALGLQDKVECVVCGDAYHANCATIIDSAASSTPKEEWYCPACLEDEKFVYEQACWGLSGRILCSIADNVEKSGSEAVDAWDYSSKILANLNRKGYDIWFAEQKEFRETGEVIVGRSRKRLPLDSRLETGHERKRGKDVGVEALGKRGRKAGVAKSDVHSAHSVELNDLASAMITSIQEENESLKNQLTTIAAERDQLLQKVAELTNALDALKGNLISSAVAKTETIEG